MRRAKGELWPAIVLPVFLAACRRGAGPQGALVNGLLVLVFLRDTVDVKGGDPELIAVSARRPDITLRW